ncbi:MAG TPA: cyclic nucleotide-binding domain-containing protein, partial [Anaerolineae bacterium]|nr:cyclic nucleotide-binding domain-containing protein [Anaerolineae bacterium]
MTDTDQSGPPPEQRSPESATWKGWADATRRSAASIVPPFLNTLSETSRVRLKELLDNEHYPANTVIFREGIPGDVLYIIWSGRVAVVKDLEGETSTLLAYGEPGDILGEISLLENGPHSASVVAVEDTCLLRLSRADLQRLVGEQSPIGVEILSALGKIVSTRLRAADEVRTSVVHAESRLARRVQQLATEKERLTELDRLRQETTDLIIHDLRNPLTCIEASLQLLQTILPEDVLASCATIIDLALGSCKDVLDLVDSLLEVARMESGDLVLDLRPLSLLPLVAGAVNRLRLLAEQYNITIELDAPAELPPVQGDGKQLERVLDNLLDNALKFTPEGGLITVAVRPVNGQVEVRVTDTGPGIPPEHRERIFDRFTRVPGSEGRRRGLGLGLAFCRSVVEAHGGR